MKPRAGREGSSLDLIGEEEFAQLLYDGNEVKSEFEVLDAPLMSEALLEKSQIRSKLFAFGGDRANASPQIAMMNTLFLREHNRLAGVVEKENSEWDDERVFQTARNIVIVLFIEIVVEEYINHISPSIGFIADPSVAWDAPWNKPNWITTEFSLLYRWHPLIPDTMKWGNREYPVADTIMNNAPLLEVGLKQGFVDMSAQRAGKIGAFNTADSLLPLEKRAIDQGRLCRLASYSDYREYASLSRPRSFSDISKNNETIEFLEGAYNRVDDVEFYVGLFSEDLDNDSPLPPLMRAMVAVDAFSQAFTNPLLSRHVWNEETFTEVGWRTIRETNNLRDILQRNVAGSLGDDVFVGMTRSNWKAS